MDQTSEELRLHRSKTEKLFWKYGIPKDAWKVEKLSSLPFAAYVYAGFNFPSSVQRNALKEVWTTPRRQIVCIAQGKGTKRGKGADIARSAEPAVEAGMFVLRKIVSNHRYPVQIIQAGLNIDVKAKPRAVLIHNVLGEATSARLEKVRDEIFRYTNAVRLIVVSACNYPEDFCRNRLGIYPTSCCLLK